jgi:predicted RNA-binding protein
MHLIFIEDGTGKVLNIDILGDIKRVWGMRVVRNEVKGGKLKL